MTEADVPLGLRLREHAGWNQLDADWRRMLALEPEGCFVAELDGRPVGTVATCTFGKIAWIAMVLVDPEARGQGVGTALMNHAISHLEANGITSIRLDATPMGKPIYEKLGFKSQFDLARWEGELAELGEQGTVDEPPTTLEIISPSDGEMEQAYALDQRLTHTPRRKLIERLHGEYPNQTRVAVDDGKVVGYLMLRPGANAMQIGPAIAETVDAGVHLLEDAVQRLAGRRVFIDLVQANDAASAIVEAWGLTVQRPFTRMTRGEQVQENVEALWASSGPEKG